MAIQFPLLLGLGGASAAVAWRRHSRLEVRSLPDAGYSTYRGGRYCGPGWGFVRQDVERGKIAALPDALDAIDEACRHHDQCYHDNGWWSQQCNVRLAAELAVIVRSPMSTPQQRVDAAVMAAVFAIEAVGVDPWLRPASDSVGVIGTTTRSAVDAAFQNTATMYRAIEVAICQLYGVTR